MTHRLYHHGMGHNPSRNPFRVARGGLNVTAQTAVDEYKSRSVWAAWWQLDEATRRRYFSRDERAFITRYGARLDELACHRAEPRTEREREFLRVCMGAEEPSALGHRTWLLVQIICRYHRVVTRAARADLAEHDAIALRGELRAQRAKANHLERYVVRLERDLDAATDRGWRKALDNVRCVTVRFEGPAQAGPAPRRFLVQRGRPVGLLTSTGFALP